MGRGLRSQPLRLLKQVSGRLDAQALRFANPETRGIDPKTAGEPARTGHPIVAEALADPGVGAMTKALVRFERSSVPSVGPPRAARVGYGDGQWRFVAGTSLCAGQRVTDLQISRYGAR